MYRRNSTCRCILYFCSLTRSREWKICRTKSHHVFIIVIDHHVNHVRYPTSLVLRCLCVQSDDLVSSLDIIQSVTALSAQLMLGRDCCFEAQHHLFVIFHIASNFVFSATLLFHRLPSTFVLFTFIQCLHRSCETTPIIPTFAYHEDHSCCKEGTRGQCLHWGSSRIRLECDQVYAD